MKKLLLIILYFVSTQVYAQTYNPEKINKKAVKIYEQAIEYLADGMLQEAVPFLQKAIATDTNYVDAILSMAGVYGQLKKYQQSIEYYDWAKRKDTVYFRQYHLPYSINLAGLGKFQEALTAVNYFLNIPKISDRSIKAANYRKKCFEFALMYSAMNVDTSYSFAPENLGDSINTSNNEYYPSVTIDDSLLVFTRSGRGIREDFYESKLEKDGYRKATLMKGDINLEPSKGALTISADGDWLIFAGNFGKERGFGDFDLYISFYTPEGWSEPENLGRNINTEFWESSPSLSPDKRVLYFSSNRYGGHGGKDLYYSIRMSNGKFGPAVNMGEGINTEGDEHSPFMHTDNQTFYFASDGLPGYGGSDLFVMRKLDDTTWSEPENLGYPINTIDNEGSLAVSSDGLTAFFASNRNDTRGGLDLYKFKLRKNIRPARTLYVKGKVYDKITHKGLPCTVELIENNTGGVLMKVQTDELGEYFITLPLGKNYTFTVNRKGYLFYSELYELKDKEADSTYKKDIALQPVALNSNIVLKNIQFESNSYQLLPVSLIELNNLLKILQENPTLKIEIGGHSDNTGSSSENLKLSTLRAKAVVDYLINKGIAANRLTYKGYGETKPIANNTTEEGRAKNRRTEFTVIAL